MSARGRRAARRMRGVRPEGRRVFMALLALLAAASAPGTEARGAERPAVRQELPVTANDLGKPRAQNSPVLAADPTNPRFVALANRLDAPGFGCALQVSGDAGRGWQPTNPVPDLPPGAERCYAPEIAFDRGGTLYYLFLGLRGRGNTPIGAFLTTSDDRGQSFSTPRRLLGPGNYQVRMALDPTMGEQGRIHLVWLHLSEDAPTGGLPPPPNPILSAYSD
ncbi:MAG: sialidase family protein, partial [Gammaproteobacteria bacterium]